LFKIAAVVVLSVTLTACSTTSQAERVATSRSTCSSYGFKEGTDAYANCLLQMDIAAKTEDRAARDRIRNGLLAMSQSMTPRRPVTCNTTGTATRTYGTTFGNATTTCY
jgi:hypothetical protein